MAAPERAAEPLAEARAGSIPHGEGLATKSLPGAVPPRDPASVRDADVRPPVADEEAPSSAASAHAAAGWQRQGAAPRSFTQEGAAAAALAAAAGLVAPVVLAEVWRRRCR